MLVAHAFSPNPENKPEIDHIDGDELNNHAWNLRWVMRSENNRNRRLFKNNTTGFRGVSYRADRGKFRACVDVNKKRKVVGYYDTAEEADRKMEEYRQQIEYFKC